MARLLNKDTIIVAVIWICSSLAGEVLLFVYGEHMFPVQGSTQALIVDDAFFLLVALGIPIFLLVVTSVIYSLVRFSNNSDDIEDAKPVSFHKGFAWTWLMVSSVLCLGVIIFPGYTGLLELRSTANTPPDLLIEVTGQRWIWTFEYIDQKTHEPIVKLRGANETLVLPNESLIRFKITALDSDVLHSFWIPAFRLKIDAVPGLVTSLDVTTNRIGNYEDDIMYRVQCAELCGVSHSTMMNKVEVIDKDEFEKWLTEKKK
jgi:cytochrome c oxidase subunit 2